MNRLALIILFGLCAPCCLAQDATRTKVVDEDRDHDGLSDFQEVHKYGTDPKKKDSDGDGVPDGDWGERREYSYTIRSVIQVMPTYDKATLNDDYQDCRVLYECPQYIELEVVHYPLNTCSTTIKGRLKWRKAARAMRDYTKAGVTTNFDAAMQRDLLRRLQAGGIDLKKLTDKEVVEQVSKWALEHAKSLGRTCVWAVGFDSRGKPVIPPTLAAKFANNKGDAGWSEAQQFERELYGKGMFENGTRGTCTTSANYLTTILRAVGIPTRCIVTIPVVDGSDERNVEMLENRLTHHAVRRDIMRGVKALKSSFAAHTYNEVWIDGRWRRLNYTALGQNTLDANYMGLMTHVHTFSDLAEAGLVSGWGLGKQKPSDVFRHNNPYTCLTVSDQFGVHAEIDNPEVDGPKNSFAVSKACWFDSDGRPGGISGDWSGAADKRQGHLLLFVDGIGSNDDAADFRAFFGEVDKAFLLQAEGQRDVVAHATGNWWEGGRILHLCIEEGSYGALKPGVRYKLTGRESAKRYRWQVGEIHVSRLPD